MSFNHVVTIGWNRGADSISTLSTITDNTEEDIDIPVPASTTNLPVTIAFAVARVKSLFILTDQDMTLKTNDSTTPANSISLLANVPLVWTSVANYFANPFTVDVTEIFLTNATTTTGICKLRMIRHST